jgi:hypothetical protein
MDLIEYRNELVSMILNDCQSDGLSMRESERALMSDRRIIEVDKALVDEQARKNNVVISVGVTEFDEIDCEVLK